MEINPSLNLSNEILPIVPQRWHYRLAEWISRLFSPPLVATVALAAIALADFSRAALVWAFLTLLLMILTPAGYLVYLHQRGQITDLDVYVRHQRTRPYLLSIGCSLVTFALLNTANAPYLLQIVAAAAIFQTSGLFAVNLKWKISAHTAATAGFSSLFFWVGGISALPVWLFIPVVAWSRVHLKRHTLYQTIAGSLWGVISFTLAFWLLQ
jgi:membrane-associated phospholipid phosphatase